MRLTQPGVTGGSSQPGGRDEPTLQWVCAHVPWLALHVRLPQNVRTSFTHCPSQNVPQQNGSASQIALTQALHAGTSAPPTVQVACVQVWASGQIPPLF